MWHKQSDADSGNSGVMKLTPDHYIAMGLSWAEHSMVPARALQPGMHIFIASSKVSMWKVSLVPQSLNGVVACMTLLALYH